MKGQTKWSSRRRPTSAYFRRFRFYSLNSPDFPGSGSAVSLFLEEYIKLEVPRGSMNLLNQIFLNCVTIRVWGMVVALTLGLSGCSVVRPPNSQPPHYFWDSNLQTKQLHAAVACTSLHSLLTFNRLYDSETAKDKLEEATLLGESSYYASDEPPDPPCQRAGRPVGPVNAPGSTDRVKNITESSDGTVSFQWDFAPAVAASLRQTQTYYTYPEYLVSAGRLVR